MKRSILLSMLAVGAVAAMITAATSASFSDQVTSGGNTATAGTLKMSIDGECGGRIHGGGGAGGAGVDGNAGCTMTPGSFTVTNAKPGGTATTKIYAVQNAGSLPGTLNVTATATTTSLTCPASNWTVSVTAPALPAAVGAGVTQNVTVSAALAASAPNTCQGQSATVAVVFDLDQA